MALVIMALVIMALVIRALVIRAQMESRNKWHTDVNLFYDPKLIPSTLP